MLLFCDYYVTLNHFCPYIVCSKFQEFVGDLAKAATESKKEDFVLECVGVLSNLHLPDLDWAEIFKHFNMIEWVRSILTSNNKEPDSILQVRLFPKKKYSNIRQIIEKKKPYHKISLYWMHVSTATVSSSRIKLKSVQWNFVVKFFFFFLIFVQLVP